MEWLKSLVGAITAPATEWLRGYGERAKIREQGRIVITEAEVRGDIAAAEASAQRAAAQDAADQQWDIEASRAAARSWKDELWTIVFALPIVLAFVPGGAGLVAVGFQSIAQAPGWYQAGFAASIAFAYGIRHVVNMVRERWR